MTFSSMCHQIFTEVYALYVKTQNYHWNVHGSSFYALHLLFEKHYNILSDLIDDFAEKLRANGENVQAGLQYFAKTTKTEDANVSFSQENMLEDLKKTQKQLILLIQEAKQIANESDAFESIMKDFLTNTQDVLFKMTWMLQSHQS